MYNVLKYRKYGEITTHFQFTGTGEQPHRNRKLIQFDFAQYRISEAASHDAWTSSFISFKAFITFICYRKYVPLNTSKKIFTKKNT